MKASFFIPFFILFSGLGLHLSADAETADTSPAPAHQVELIRLVRQDCGACHGMTLKGGLGSPLLPENLRDKPASSLVATVLHGRPGTAMPAWKTILSEADAEWIITKLLAGFPQDAQ